MISIAVVILNYNGKELLEKFLPSVIHCSNQADIIVADNNSLDGSQALIHNNFPTVKLIQIPDNLGFCGGYNYALNRISADYYVLLNSDIKVTPNWINPIIDLFENDETIGAAQPKVLSYKEKNKFEHAGAAGGFIDILGYPFCRGRIFNTIEEDMHQYDDVIPVFWVTGACLFIRAELFKKLGGFDEELFAHMEEIDLCWHLNRLGYKVMYYGNSSVYHVGGATLPSSNHIKTYYNFRNSLIILIKNMSTSQLILRLPIRLLLDWVASLKFFLAGYWLDALVVLKAHVYLVQNSGRLWRKRGKSKKLTPSYKTNLIYGRSIVFDYFIMKRRSYRDLKFNPFK